MLCLHTSHRQSMVMNCTVSAHFTQAKQQDELHCVCTLHTGKTMRWTALSAHFTQTKHGDEVSCVCTLHTDKAWWLTVLCLHTSHTQSMVMKSAVSAQLDTDKEWWLTELCPHTLQAWWLTVLCLYTSHRQSMVTNCAISEHFTQKKHGDQLCYFCTLHTDKAWQLRMVGLHVFLFQKPPSLIVHCMYWASIYIIVYIWAMNVSQIWSKFYTEYYYY